MYPEIKKEYETAGALQDEEIYNRYMDGVVAYRCHAGTDRQYKDGKRYQTRVTPPACGEAEFALQLCDRLETEVAFDVPDYIKDAILFIAPSE